MTNKFLEKLALDIMPNPIVRKKENIPHVSKLISAIKEKDIRVASPLLKMAADQLKPQQERALAKMDQNGGVVLAHGLGTGKTLTFLTAAQRAQEKDKKARVLIIAPASLTNNVDKQIKKHKVKIDRSRLDVLSYEKATRDADRLAKNHYALAIGDEAQRLRNVGTQRHKLLGSLISNSDNRLLATATPQFNHASDIGPLVNIAAGHKVLPEGKKTFEDQFVSKKKENAPILKRIFGAPPVEVETLKNKHELKRALNKYIDYYSTDGDPEAQSHFPVKHEKTVEVEMSPLQHRLYKYSEGELPWALRLKIRANIPLDKKDAAQVQAFSSSIRQVSNSTRKYMPNYDEPTPKIEAAVDSLEKSYREDPRFRGLVYSNYLEAGLDDYSKELHKRGIPHTLFTGQLNKAQKAQAEEEYNSGKTPILLVSSSGSEGLNLLKTRKVQILEPHWNEARVDQVIGRSARYDSHKDLPLKDRNVEVERYLSVFPSGPLGKSRSSSIDQYMAHNSRQKQHLSDQITNLFDQPDNK